MSKLLLVLMAIMLSGCELPQYEIICSSKGDLFKQYQGVGDYHAEAMKNKRQLCYNQPDGSILIKSADAIK